MIDPAWVSVSVVAAGAFIAFGAYLGVARSQDKIREADEARRKEAAEIDDQRRLEDKEQDAAWRSDIKIAIATLTTDLKGLLTSSPVLTERMNNFERELQFQRGRIHELSNQVMVVQARDEERHASSSRDIDELRERIDHLKGRTT